MGSFVPFGGFFSSPPDFKNPVRSKSHYSTLCYLCTEKLEQEVAALLKLESSDSVTDQCLDNLTSSDRIAALDTSKGVGTAKVCYSNFRIFDSIRMCAHALSTQLQNLPIFSCSELNVQSIFCILFTE